jgi:hypothetical protein
MLASYDYHALISKNKQILQYVVEAREPHTTFVHKNIASELCMSALYEDLSRAADMASCLAYASEGRCPQKSDLIKILLFI